MAGGFGEPIEGPDPQLEALGLVEVPPDVNSQLAGFSQLEDFGPAPISVEAAADGPESVAPPPLDPEVTTE
ncbi:hypothetical protein [Nocardia phage NBR1]|uniref:hypothetical protein n=1 Tax=Nocardia phage NBR1 TaxID=1109711 RepID=UPI00023EEDE2|nr:hypothetical protein NoPhNBR1_gp31 [Nocardia phage NBR1]AEV52244.1 hypothetical protein [Nocardia phage NBR1]